MSDNENLRKRIAEAIKDGITFSGQIGDYVITGAIDKLDVIIQHEAIKRNDKYSKMLTKADEQFNALVEKVNELTKAGAGHKLGEINNWLDKYANEEDWSVNWRKILKERELID